MIERGADPNPKFPDGTWMRDNIANPQFPARIVNARQVYAAKTSATPTNLLLNILNSSSAPAAGVSPSSNSGPSSPIVRSPSAGSSNGLGMMKSGSNDSFASPTSGRAITAPSPKNTMRRSTISLKATADKEIVMDGTPSSLKTSSGNITASSTNGMQHSSSSNGLNGSTMNNSAYSTSNSSAYGSPASSVPTSAPSASVAVASMRGALANAPNSRRGSVTYATIRPRSTLSSAEGVALRQEVSNQMAASGTGGLARSTSSIPSSSNIALSNASSAPGNGASLASSTDGSAPMAASPASPAPIDVNAGSAISGAMASDSQDPSKKSKKSKDKKDKKDKKEKKEKKEQKEREKEIKKLKRQTRSEEQPAVEVPVVSSSTMTKKEQKEYFRRKQAEEEAAKAEARAEKTKKRSTISWFSKTPKAEKDEKKAEKATAKAEKDEKKKTLNFEIPTINAAVQASVSSAPNTPASPASPHAPNSPPLSPASGQLSPSSTSPPLSPHSARSPPLSPTGPRQVTKDGTGAAYVEQTALVDTVPDGAVALPNGDFLVGVDNDAVNLDALTEAMAKVVREANSPLLGTPNFEIKALLEATKTLSTTLKSILAVSEVYSLTLESEQAGEEFKSITEALRNETARSLVAAIKSVTVDSSDTKPLKSAMAELSVSVSKLYKCLESASGAVVVEMLQTVVIHLRSVVSAAKSSETREEMQSACSQAVVIAMRLTSLVQDFAFANCRSLRNKRSLYDSAFALAQSVRGLVVAALGVFADPSSEAHQNGMAQMLKTAAEYVRSISRTLREEETYTSNPRLAAEADHSLEPAPQDVVLAYLRKGCGLMANAKDKYVARATAGGLTLADDERQILSVVVSQAQHVASLMEALPLNDMPRLTQMAVSTGASISSLQRLLQPLLDTCLEEELVDEIVACLENSIRCSIQVKILASLIASHGSSAEFRLQLAQMCQLWGVYSTLLLDSVWRAVHLL